MVNAIWVTPMSSVAVMVSVNCVDREYVSPLLTTIDPGRRAACRFRSESALAPRTVTEQASDAVEAWAPCVS